MEDISYFPDVIGWGLGRRNFAVIRKTMNYSRSNVPRFETVSRHWTAGGAERKAKRLNAEQAALSVFRSLGR